jgi:endonuclease G
MADVHNGLKGKVPVKSYPHAQFPPAPDSKRRKPPEPGVEKIGLESVQEFDKLSKEEQWQELVGALRLHRRRLMRIPGVTAVDLGYKIRDQKFTDKLALRVHVERKLPEPVFKDRQYDLIPKKGDTSDIPPEQKFLGPRGYAVPMDVIEAEYKPLQLAELPQRSMVLETPQKPEDVNRRRRLDPLVGGISIGNPQVPVGTLGALVWDRTDGSVCILSNWHVLSGDLHAEIGTPCFQPGRFDQGRASDVVARLKRWSFDHQTDAAIAELTGSRHYCAGEIVSMYQQISGVEEKPHLGMKVLKSGRSTGLTPGFIDGLYFSAAIKYSNGIVRVFEDQIHIAPLAPDDPAEPVSRISEPGDSGSVWVTGANGNGYRAVGLHFAGDLPSSAFGEYALANPMTVVVNQLDFSFRPLFLEIRNKDVASLPLPLVSQLVQGNGIQPQDVIGGGRLTGASSQPDPILVEPNGSR